MIHKKITFVGGGNITRALVQGLLENDYPPEHITISNYSSEKLSFFAEHGLHTTQDNVTAVKEADIIILAVKPDQIEAVCQEISFHINSHALIVSIAARIRIDRIAACFHSNHSIIRAMPNIGVAVSAGVIGLCANDAASEVCQEPIETLFAALGLVIWVEEESLLTVVTAVSGSGIAYYFRFMEIMQKEATQLGLPAEVAQLMVAETALGAAKLALESEEDIIKLRHQVTSPKGSTEQAIKVMDEAGLEHIIKQAMYAVVMHES